MVIDIEQPGRVPPLADPEVRRLRAIGIPAAAEWLRRHSDHAWDQDGDGVRQSVASRLLFAMFLMSEGRLGDEIPTEEMIRRGVGIPSGRGGAER